MAYDKDTLAAAAAVAKSVADDYHEKAEACGTEDQRRFIACMLVCGEAQRIADRIMELGD